MKNKFLTLLIILTALLILPSHSARAEDTGTCTCALVGTGCGSRPNAGTSAENKTNAECTVFCGSADCAIWEPASPVGTTPTQVRTQVNTSIGNLFRSGGYQTTGPAANVNTVIGYIISGLLLMVGSIFMIIIIYSGIRWMTAGGNKETVEQARKRIIRAATGLAIVLGAWIITRFVLTGLLNPNRGTSSWFSRQP